MLAIDIESTTHSKGNPFDTRNVLVTVAINNGKENLLFNCYKYPKLLDKVREICYSDRSWITFNGKFDIHWLRKMGIPPPLRVWDCQLFEFFASRQRTKFPSLDGACERLGLPVKPDKIAELWDQGVQTYDIPDEILNEYALHDTEVTYQVYLRQFEEFQTWSKERQTLFMLQCQDLLTLEEMEFNGFPFDRERSLKLAAENDMKVQQLQEKLDLHHNVPGFSWSSNHHLSALLYGGRIVQKVRVPNGVYKSGKKAGEIKFKVEEREYVLPRRFKPIRGSSTTKEGVWSVDEKYLTLLDKNDELIKGMLEIKKLNKDTSTYLRGIPNRQDLLMNTDRVYSNFNQCVAATGRLSSDKPNLQNLSDAAQTCFVSEYD